MRFDANVGPGLPWKFEPEQTEIEVRIGEVVTVFYSVTNQAARTNPGVAAYNESKLANVLFSAEFNRRRPGGPRAPWDRPLPSAWMPPRRS